MTLRECYENFGGDFDSVLGRLSREQLVEKFIYKFLEDKSYSLFISSMEKKDYDEALRAVHTLKGICQNLSFTRLYESSYLATRALKENDYQSAADVVPQLSNDYKKIQNAVQEYQRCREE